MVSIIHQEPPPPLPRRILLILAMPIIHTLHRPNRYTNQQITRRCISVPVVFLAEWQQVIQLKAISVLRSVEGVVLHSSFREVEDGGAANGRRNDEDAQFGDLRIEAVSIGPGEQLRIDGWVEWLAHYDDWIRVIARCGERALDEEYIFSSDDEAWCTAIGLFDR
jgi:hypothetical protein